VSNLEADPRAKAEQDSDSENRGAVWASTMGGHQIGEAAIRLAHSDSTAHIGTAARMNRATREHLEELTLVSGATKSSGAGNRALPEPPDPERTCFERDRDRILHSPAFRRLSGKTQVFVFPEDHQRTRLTHALEVAQVAVAISRSLGLNLALTEAIALGHDCGHGPGGHASEDAFSPYIPGGYDHAVWGADTVLQPLNLCTETLDGVRNHSWSRPAPLTPEGEVVSWADRIAYVCHDFEDAAHVGIVMPEELPALVRERCGERRSQQLSAFIAAVVQAARETGQIGMTDSLAEALTCFRKFNYERIYMRPESLAQSATVIRILRALVEYLGLNPKLLPRAEAQHTPLEADSVDALAEAVTYVGGMTDRYAFTQAQQLLGWKSNDLPVGIF